MDIIQYFLNYVTTLYQNYCWLLMFVCKYIPLRQWAFDDSHSPKYQKFKVDQLKGAKEIFEFFLCEVAKRGIEGVKVMRSGCINKCDFEPVVEVDVPGCDNVLYKNVNVDIAKRILDEHVLGGKVVSEYVIKE